MCFSMARPVGVSNEPAVMLIVSLPRGRQNKLLPQVAQNPRSADSEERNHRKDCELVMVVSAMLALVIAAKWPLVRRHCSQWQAMMLRSGPVTV
jgi:hypothetical protein